MTTNPPLQPGTPAPDFELKSTPDQTVSLAERKGQRLVLLFYPADFSPVCSGEVSLFNEILPDLTDHDAQLFGISVDNVWTHLAFAEQRNLHFPLLSDFHPKGETASRYNVYRESDGECERALVLIDEDGLVQWSYVSPVGVSPGADGVLRALEDLATR
jgi:peroxiredoxin